MLYTVYCILSADFVIRLTILTVGFAGKIDNLTGRIDYFLGRIKCLANRIESKAVRNDCLANMKGN